MAAIRRFRPGRHFVSFQRYVPKCHLDVMSEMWSVIENSVLDCLLEAMMKASR